MKELIRFLTIFIVLCNFNCSGQSSSYKNVPLKYLENISIRESEKLTIYNGLKSPYAIEKDLPRYYVKDGSVDYTSIIQSAIDRNSTIVFPNFPILVNQRGLSLRSNSVVYFPENAKIILKTNNLSQYEILRIHDVENVKVYFPNIKGDRYMHVTKEGEWGMGISIRGTNNVLIYGAKIEKCWGDGIYIGVSPVTNSVINNNISIKKSIVDDNRRNGMSIISAQNLLVEDFITSNTYGTAPNAGIDIEPNSNTETINNLNFNNVTAFNNNVHGFLFVLSNLYGKEQNIGYVNLNHFISDQSQYGISLKIGTDKQGQIEKPKGTIVFDNPVLINYSKQSLLSYPENTRNKFSVKVKSINIKDRNIYSGLIKSSNNIIISK
ncbi:right-handed parallel beta-helix repeat-containing protein [Empedobacter sp.]|uniref:right-handed parallel beta-helix repeat-containing protein n=1 Tax=Empedobacter sp. TaxID=1927715 RepID=UPI00289AC820|nr:right-handed parallel beta-helix repeat-containing protein [Empedobacter sp.]